MMQFKSRISYLPVILLFAALATSCGEKKAEAAKSSEEAGHAEGAGERVKISAAAVEASRIGLSTAGSGAIQETLELTGRIVLQPSARADIHAPYPGPVRAVLRNVGDHVKKGETLARVESAESLQTYSVTAPIAGIVLDRQTSVGDVTGSDALFVVGDLTRLQAELNVVTRDIGRVSSGQSVMVSGLDGATNVVAKISAVLPTADAQSQTLIARAAIPTEDKPSLRPGMAIRGQVVLSEQQAAVAVAKDAVQPFEGKSVVFVKVGADMFEARPVTLGRNGQNSVEIMSGLRAGESYVSTNAFLVKAELGKASASHDD